MGKGSGHGEGSGDGSGAYKGKFERSFIPAMPMPAAVICCILNFLVPGLGTFVSAFSNFCCARNEDMSMAPRVVSCWINVGIALLQLVTTVFFFLGWIWSCVWGGFYIVTSLEYYHKNRPEDVDCSSDAVVTRQPGVQCVYPSPQATQPSMVIIQPSHLPFTSVPARNNPGTKTVASTGQHVAYNSRPVAPPSYQSCQPMSNQIVPSPMESPPPYPGPPNSNSLYKS